MIFFSGAKGSCMGVLPHQKPPACSVITFLSWFPLLTKDLPHKSMSEDMKLPLSAATHQPKIITMMSSNTLNLWGLTGRQISCSWSFLHGKHKQWILEVMLLNINLRSPCNKCTDYISSAIKRLIQHLGAECWAFLHHSSIKDTV